MTTWKQDMMSFKDALQMLLLIYLFHHTTTQLMKSVKKKKTKDFKQKLNDV